MAQQLSTLSVEQTSQQRAATKLKTRQPKKNTSTDTTIDTTVADPEASPATGLTATPAEFLHSVFSGETHTETTIVATTIPTQSLEPASAGPSPLMMTVASDEISSLRLLVHQQQSTINMLEHQLKFVLSFLGITETDDSTKNSTDIENAISCERFEAVEPKKPAGGTTVSAIASGADGDHELWSKVVSKRQRPHTANTFQQSVVAAVYMDQTLKKRRENSLIVTGLAQSTTITDAELFTNLCTTELNISPDIVSTRRLGRPQANRAQPLLIHLKQADQTKVLIESARKLRRSLDPAIREKVYINPNLTKAEATAAYQIRMQRRQAPQRTHQPRRNSGNQDQPLASSDDSAANNDGNGRPL
jgi:hypothetical protein